jgi:diguanylate cyclase (GGDEF)-like protein
VRERHRSISRTPEFRANLETADVATLHVLAESLVQREEAINAVVFTNSRGNFVAAGGDPVLKSHAPPVAEERPELPPGCRSELGRNDCREVVGAGDPILFASEERLVIGSSIPLFIGGRFIGRASFFEAQEPSIFGYWSKLTGAEIVLASPNEPLRHFERIVADVPPLEIRVRSSFEAERQALDRMQTAILSAGLFALLVAFALAGPLSRSLLAPLQAIEEAAHRIRKGDHSTRLGSERRDEFGEVADAFDTMLDHLESVQAGLERSQAIGRLGGWQFEVGSRSVTVTRQLEDILDLEANDDCVGMDQIIQRVHPADRPGFETALRRCELEGLGFGIDHRLICADTTERIVHTRGERVESESGSRRLEGTIQDITERKETEEQIRVLAYRDVLTGLGNRRFFAEDLQRAIAIGRQRLCPLAVLFLDLDDFKTVNDTLGHGIGDQLLCVVADHLREVVADLDSEAGAASVHRLGGDEFAVILPELSDSEAVQRCAESILHSLATPVDLDGYEVQVSASIGIATWPDEGQTVESLLAGCDTAMYHAKVQGRGQYRFYDPSMRESSERRLLLENRLRRAIDQEELEVVYQPKVAPGTGHVVGFEALLRWRDRDLGSVAPEEFVAVAEATGQILALGEWVLRKVAYQAKNWLDCGVSDVSISVNVSSLQIESETLLDTVVDILRETQLPPAHLELEMTESGLLRIEDRAIEILTDLKASGVKLSLDDFGTGYSSLSYLRRLPIDTMKIDRCFVHSIARNSRDRAFVESILSMANVLGLDVVVEGVEEAAQRDVLHAMGCTMIQGWFYSKGVPADQVAEMVAQGFPPASRRC